eukprot:TRINITY_DN1452_c2_g1_i1.p1 TRINITY_DN1452_c2_g1~~TRINITY_DN1452_c2_g1_i1.p1  ORF type:complete len:319 (-),score=78.24 TRINITY_DN1452_c2_g1_i1:81-1037(-)
MFCRVQMLRFFLCSLVAVGTSNVASTVELDITDVGIHLQEDDECSIRGEECALQALQIRGKRVDVSRKLGERQEPDEPDDEVPDDSGNTADDDDNPDGTDESEGEQQEGEADADVELDGTVDLLAGLDDDGTDLPAEVIAALEAGANMSIDGQDLPAEVISALEAGSNTSIGSEEGYNYVIPLYHQTSPEIAKKILRGGFRAGHAGWCGGGIYFAATPEATTRKAIGFHSHHGAIIQAMVNVGKVRWMPPKCTSSPYCYGVACLSTGSPGGWLRSQGFDSIAFNPIDGVEYVIYDPKKVVSMKILPPAPAAPPFPYYR